jgi:hypothetical protein
MMVYTLTTEEMEDLALQTVRLTLKLLHGEGHITEEQMLKYRECIGIKVKEKKWWQKFFPCLAERHEGDLIMYLYKIQLHECEEE